MSKQLDKAVEEAENFESFWNNNKPLLIEYAEKQTGETISGLEPLLTIDGVRVIAQEYWEDVKD